MKQSINATFDGQVFRPDEPLTLPANQRYRITIETAEPAEAAATPNLLADILAMAQDLGVPDLAEQHDHYLYGLPKR